MSVAPDPMVVHSSEPAPQRTRGTWHGKAASLLFAIFCMELGFFLLVFPWTDAWFANRFSTFAAESYWSVTVAAWWRQLWPNAFFRGAVSGLGFVNLYIALAEILALRRFVRPQEDDN